MRLIWYLQLVLVALGLQYKTVDELAADLRTLETEGLKSTSASEILGHLREVVRSLVKAVAPLVK